MVLIHELYFKYLLFYQPQFHVACHIPAARGIRQPALIENMPKVELNDEPIIGYSSVQIEEFIGDDNMGWCLDFWKSDERFI